MFGRGVSFKRWLCQEAGARAGEEESSRDLSPKLCSKSPEIFPISSSFVLMNFICRLVFLVPFSLPIAIGISKEQLLLNKWLAPNNKMQTDLKDD